MLDKLLFLSVFPSSFLTSCQNCVGGPAVGDIRSRCLRLSDESTAEALAVRTLLGHRLPMDADIAKSEW